MTSGPASRQNFVVRVELCREADVPLLMRFIGAQWQAGHILSRDEVLLRWQFAPQLLDGRAPTATPTVLLAWIDDELVGILGLTGFRFNAAGQQFPATWLSHWFAAPAYRRHNVALRLVWAIRDLGVEVVGTVGASEVATKLLAQLGFEVIPSLPRWVGVFDLEAAVELVCAANPGVPLEDITRFCRSHVVEVRDAPSDGGFHAVHSNATAAGAWDRFWSERLAPQLVAASRDAAYLGWRYLAHPRFEYHLRFAQRESDGAVEGIAVFRVEHVRDRATRVLRIVEFLASEAAEASLVRCVVEAARESSCAIGDFYCSSARAAQALARAGFTRQAGDAGEHAFPARFQPLEAGHHQMRTLIRLPAGWRGTLPQLVADGRLYITKSDGDQDRPN